MPFQNRTIELSTIAFSFIFLERWQMPVKANIYKIIKIFCFFIWWLQNKLYICSVIINQ